MDQNQFERKDSLLDKSSAWTAAKVEYLDVSRPKPKMATLALKYGCDIRSLMKTCISQDWDMIRSNAETAAILSVNPETRVAVVKQVDTILLRTAEQVARSAGNAYMELVEEVRGLETDSGDEVPEEESPDGPRGKKPKKPKGKPTLFAKIAMLNALTEGFGTFSEQMHKIGWVITPEVAPTADQALKKALNVSQIAPPSDIPPPPPVSG